MGWIYGSTIVNTNNSVETPSYQYDKIFSNYYLARNTESVDNVFLGRKILVDYHQPLTDTLTRVAASTNEEGETKYYYWKPADSNGETKYTDIDAVEIDTLPLGTYVYMLSEDNVITYLECQEENGSKILSNENVLSTLYINNKNLSTYEFNLKLDKEHGAEKSYDSTVWQKTYVGNDIKYILIAELNAQNPVFDLLVIPPGSNGIANIPEINVESNDKYKLILSTQPGFRVSDQPFHKVEPYRPGIYKYDNESGNRVIDYELTYTEGREYYRNNQFVKIYDNYKQDTFYIEQEGQFVLDNTSSGSEIEATQYYLYASDVMSKYSKYIDNNTIGSTDSIPSAIYYNKAGLDKNTRSVVNIQDAITLSQKGKRGYNYRQADSYKRADDINADNFDVNKKSLDYMIDNDSGYTQVSDNESFNEEKKYYRPITTVSGQQVDTNQLSICLPTIGNMVAEGWDKIYGEDRNTILHDIQKNADNKIIYTPAQNANSDSNSLAGLYNFYAAELGRVAEYDENLNASAINYISKAIPLEQGEQLIGSDIIQNQIAINNIGIKSIADKIGLSFEDIVYESVSNITPDSFVSGLYFIKNGDKYEPATSYWADSDEIIPNILYACRIKSVNYTENESTPIQTQINVNQINIEKNQNNLNERKTDISNLIASAGFAKTQDGSETSSFDISIDNRYEGEDKENYTRQDQTLQGQIHRNDIDIKNLIKLLGFSRSVEEFQGSNDETYGVQEGIITNQDTPIQTQINNNDIDITKLIARIQNIERFLLDGHFLFTWGRSLKDFNIDEKNLLDEELTTT